MKKKMENLFGHSSPAEWGECLKHEARGALILLYGIEEPTERQIATYVLYGDAPFLKQNMRAKQISNQCKRSDITQ